jgi:hypothetical protein
MANAITGAGLAVLFESFKFNKNIKLVGTLTNGSGTTSWESTSEPISFLSQPQSGQANVLNLQTDVVFEIPFPAGTVSIDFDEVHLVDRNDRDKVYLIADITGGSVQYTGTGEFTVTDFDVDFSPTPTE